MAEPKQLKTNNMNNDLLIKQQLALELDDRKTFLSNIEGACKLSKDIGTYNSFEADNGEVISRLTNEISLLERLIEKYKTVQKDLK